MHGDLSTTRVENSRCLTVRPISSPANISPPGLLSQTTARLTSLSARTFSNLASSPLTISPSMPTKESPRLLLTGTAWIVAAEAAEVRAVNATSPAPHFLRLFTRGLLGLCGDRAAKAPPLTDGHG